jgi:dTDP-4-dehydrorhamnose reductase
MILVTGAGGQVGVELQRRAPLRGITAVGLTRDGLDITDADAVRRTVSGVAGQAWAVVNAAAYTAVDKAETNADAANAANRDAPGHLAAACAESGLPLIHISTDYVFDGRKDGAYVESDPVAPLGVYGASKEAGERAVRAACAEHVILRTSWVYAGHGGNFVRTMLRLGSERDELRVVADQTGVPTYAGDIAEAIIAIVWQLRGGKRDGWGTFHYAARGTTTWHGFAEDIIRRAAPVTGRRPPVVPITTADYPTPAPRPRNSVLDCTAFDRTFEVPRRQWGDGLADALAELLEGKANRGEGNA